MVDQLDQAKRVSKRNTIREDRQEMSRLYTNAKAMIATGEGLNKENILDLVNTIIGRKRLKLTICQVMTDYFLSMLPYKTLKRLPVSKKALDRRRVFNQA